MYTFQSADSNYVCVFVDYTTGSTIDLFPSRKIVELGKYLSFIPLEERKKVEIVSIDMWDTYRILAKDYFPSSVVSVDKLCKALHNLSALFPALRIPVLPMPKITK